MDQKLRFTYPYASINNVQVTEEALNSQKRPSNTSEHELKIFFLLLWVIFALLDPDPDSESGSTDPIESGSGSAPGFNDLYLFDNIVLSISTKMSRQDPYPAGSVTIIFLPDP